MLVPLNGGTRVDNLWELAEGGKWDRNFSDTHTTPPHTHTLGGRERKRERGRVLLYLERDLMYTVALA